MKGRVGGTGISGSLAASKSNSVRERVQLFESYRDGSLVDAILKPGIWGIKRRFGTH